MRRPLVVLSLVLTLSAACSSSGDDNAATTTSVRGAPSPTTPATAPAGTAAAGTCPGQPPPGASGPPPAQGSALADGHWFGYVTLLDAEDLSLRFDVAQLLVGDAATKAAAEDGGEPDNDYWIRNNTNATRALPLAEDATLCTADPENSTKNRRVSLAQLNQTLGDGEPIAVWIDVRGGTVERVEQQYFP